jgi:hypothetical protein
MLLYNPNYPKQSREISLALYIRDGVVEASWWIMCPHNILIRKVKCEVDKKVGVWVHGRITYWCPVLSKLRTDRKQRWSAAYQSKRRLPITSGREGVKMTTSKSVFFFMVTCRHGGEANKQKELQEDSLPERRQAVQPQLLGGVHAHSAPITLHVCRLYVYVHM